MFGVFLLLRLLAAAVAAHWYAHMNVSFSVIIFAILFYNEESLQARL
jgi:hypothetical protein